MSGYVRRGVEEVENMKGGVRVQMRLIKRRGFKSGGELRVGSNRPQLILFFDGDSNDILLHKAFTLCSILWTIS